MPSSPKPRDLTASLLRYGEKRAQALRSALPGKQMPEREMTFDPFAFGVWCAVGCLLVAQVILLVLLEFV